MTKPARMCPWTSPWSVGQTKDAKRKISSNDEEVVTHEMISALSHFPSESNADWLRQEIAIAFPIESSPYPITVAIESVVQLSST